MDKALDCPDKLRPLRNCSGNCLRFCSLKTEIVYGDVPEHLNVRILHQKWNFPLNKRGPIAVKRFSTTRCRSGTSPVGAEDCKVWSCADFTSPASSNIIGQAVHAGKKKIFVYLFICKPFFLLLLRQMKWFHASLGRNMHVQATQMLTVVLHSDFYHIQIQSGAKHIRTCVYASDKDQGNSTKFKIRLQHLDLCGFTSFVSHFSAVWQQKHTRKLKLLLKM